MTEPKLARGQIEFHAGLTIRNAHEVRKLRLCAGCGQFGKIDNMINVREKLECWHGRCYAEKFGVTALLRCDPDDLAHLTIGDLGVDLMIAVMNRMAEK